MAHRNLTSTSLNDISDKPEKDQVSSRSSLLSGFGEELDVGERAPLYLSTEKEEGEQGEWVFLSPVTGSSTL